MQAAVPPRQEDGRATFSRLSSYEPEEDDPKALASLLERVLRKVSVIPGALEAISSDQELLRELQEHELLFYPSKPPQPRTAPQLSPKDSLSSSEMRPSMEWDRKYAPICDDEDDGDDFPRTSLSMNIPAPIVPPAAILSTSLASNSPSFSMGMLSMSPGTSSLDGEPALALWPRQPNEFAFTQEDEVKEDELYNEVLCSEDEDEAKVFEMDMDQDEPFIATAEKMTATLLTEDDEDEEDDGDDAEIEYESMRLRIVREKNKTGFEPSQEWEAHAGVLLGGQYSIRGLIGEAVFSQTYKATDIRTGLLVCLKVIKNNKEYFDQGIDEIRILEYLKSAGNVDEYHILKLLDYFYYKEHLILVTELLRDNLYEFSRMVRVQPDHSSLGSYFTLSRLKKIAIECLEALSFLHSLHIVHCDLKPENIVMKSFQKCQIKIIDFGSASFVSDELTFYVQSRSYRAPEVILGLRYDEKVDVWSLGCILAEIYTGHVLFQNDSVASLLAKIISIVGPIPADMFAGATEMSKYFDAELTLLHPMPPKTSLWHELNCADHLFIDFLQTLLQVNPQRRVTASAALKHPWLQSNVFGLQ